MVLLKSALKPIAVLSEPVLFKSASSPRTVLWFVKQPSWHTARAWGKSARQTRASGIRIKPSRKGDRPIVFMCGVFIFMFFPFIILLRDFLTEVPENLSEKTEILRVVVKQIIPHPE